MGDADKAEQWVEVLNQPPPTERAVASQAALDEDAALFMAQLEEGGG